MRTTLQMTSPDTGRPYQLQLPAGRGAALAQLKTWLHDATLQRLLPPPGHLRLELGNRPILIGELQQLKATLAAVGLELVGVTSGNPDTRVAAAALGLDWEWASGASQHAATATNPDSRPTEVVRLTVHEGTVRAGDHLDVTGSLLVLGDVNPGAQVTAAGDVLVWGRLRGVAHAGSAGDQGARIVALQLRPLQLRIADVVARGPADPPLPGQAEQATLEAGTIAIQPARPSWPVAHEQGAGLNLPPRQRAL